MAGDRRILYRRLGRPVGDGHRRQFGMVRSRFRDLLERGQGRHVGRAANHAGAPRRRLRGDRPGDGAGRLEETKVVSNIETINEVLRPVEQRFGSEKASLVRNLIYKQAEIGIKRKLLESVASETRKIEMEAIIKELASEVDVLRQNIGSYCMMMVREVYLGQDLQIWNLLNARVAAAGLGQKGGGLWDRVATRVKQNPDEAEKP